MSDRRPSGSMSLLSSLISDAIASDYPHPPRDPGAAGGSDRPRHPRRTGWRWAAAAATALAALILVAAALAARGAEPTLAQQRASLAQAIAAIQEDMAVTEGRLDQVRARVAALEADVLAESEVGQALAERVARAAAVAGYEPVTGPGVAITLTDSPDGDRLGQVMDRDIQVVVNGLWQAGASAVAVNGQRLTARTAIRVAGEAILVDYRPLAPPYVVEAVAPDGDAEGLVAAFVETGTAAVLDDLTETYGVGWELVEVEDLTLPAGRSALPMSDQPRDGQEVTP